MSVGAVVGILPAHPPFRPTGTLRLDGHGVFRW
jgi:hypothetical protein